MSSQLTIVGNLAADPELRFTSGGKAVANFTIVTSRSVKGADGTWDNDVDRTYWPCTVWDKIAEHVCESLGKGDAVIAIGYASTRSWEGKDGSKGSRMEVNVTEVAASMRRTTVTVHRSERAPGHGSTSTADPWGPSKTDEEIPPF